MDSLRGNITTYIHQVHKPTEQVTGFLPQACSSFHNKQLITYLPIQLLISSIGRWDKETNVSSLRGKRVHGTIPNLTYWSFKYTTLVLRVLESYTEIIFCPKISPLVNFTLVI